MNKPLSESLGQEVVTKWSCKRMFGGDYLVKSAEFRVTPATFVMLKPEEQSDDSTTVFDYSTRFHHSDPRLSDSAKQAIIKMEKIEKSKVEILRGKIAKSQEIIIEVRRFLAQWELINPG